jgi:hypothetical protein
MKRFALPAAAACCLFLAMPVWGAAPPANDPPREIKAAARPAALCLTDIRAFDDQMEKDGYWLGGSGYGFGYPLGGIGYGDPTLPANSADTVQNARPGYEVRVLLASATILADNGQQRACESVLATMRQAYAVYVADLHEQGLRTADGPAWQQQQIASAQPVTS